MRHLLLMAGAAMLIAAPALRADEPTKDESRADQVKSIKESFQKAQIEYSKLIREAKTNEERQEALKKRPNLEEFASKAKKIVDANPKDEAALDALLFMIPLSRTSASKAFDLLAEHHITNPKVASVAQLAASLNHTKFLEGMLEKNEDRKAKAMAAMALGTSYHNMAARQPNKAEELDKKAEQYLERVEKEFADVEITPMIGTRPAVVAGDQAKKILWEIRNLGIGKPVPEVISENLEGDKVKLSDLKGKVVVLDFWATWCPPCRAMIPHSRKLVEKMKDKPFVLVSISSDAKKETLKEFIEKEPMPWTHWWEGTKEDSVGRKWNITGIPTVYIVDAEGKIRYKQVGFNSAEPDKIDKQVEKLLEEMEKK